MGLIRGDVAVVALAGDYGKPRPAVVLQSDLFESLESLVVVPLTSDLRPISALIRLRIDPTESNGLMIASELMVDKMSAISRRRIGKKIGRLDDGKLAELSAAVALLLGL